MSRSCVLALVLGLASGLCAPARALYTVAILAREGEPLSAAMAESHHWPEGVLALANDPLRSEVRQQWFSGLPNDRVEVVFRLATSDDVIHLIQRLAEVKAAELRLELLPGDGPPDGLGTRGETSPGASFTVGDQAALDAWYRRLPEVEPGVRQCGVWRYQKPPEAAPPTLTLYLDNPHVVLQDLRVPDRITVEARRNWEWDETAQKWMPPPDAVKQFLEQHQARQTGSRAREGGDPVPAGRR